MLIALTGGIAAGKSTVAQTWEKLGAFHIDADQLARDVVQPGTVGLKKVQVEFGDEYIKDGALDREKMGALIFSNTSARKRLEEILHPLIQERAQELIAQNEGRTIVYSIPLLVESRSPLKFDQIVSVSAPEEVRVQRLMTARGMSLEDAISRIRSQASDQERSLVSDYVIDSNCSLIELNARAEKLWHELKQQNG